MLMANSVQKPIAKPRPTVGPSIDNERSSKNRHSNTTRHLSIWARSGRSLHNQPMSAKRDLAAIREAAHRRAVVRRYDLCDWHFMAAKHILTIRPAQQQPNRRAGGRPGDARRPAALIPRG
tara:strand:- start:200 stop:562 length:363 start_codon:yes stop_codon:yes gene_type:complete